MSMSDDLQAIQDGVDAGVITPRQARALLRAMEKKAKEEQQRREDAGDE